MVSSFRLLASALCLFVVSPELCVVAAQSAALDPAAEVNPFIGTTNGGNVFPGAAVPFGMVQFSPEAAPFKAKRMIAAPGGYLHG